MLENNDGGFQPILMSMTFNIAAIAITTAARLMVLFVVVAIDTPLPSRPLSSFKANLIPGWFRRGSTRKTDRLSRQCVFSISSRIRQHTLSDRFGKPTRPNRRPTLYCVYILYTLSR